MPSRGEGRKLRRILTGLAVLLFALAGIALNVSWLLADGYGNVAADRLASRSSAADGLIAAQSAVRLTPFPDWKSAVLARLLAVHGRDQEALQVFRGILRETDADPFLWQNFIHLKLELGQHDPELRQALQQVQKLAPNSYALHFENALLGLYYWNWTDVATRHAWRDSIRQVIDISPKPFLAAVLSGRRESVLCGDPLLKDERLKSWCQGAKIARKTCFTGPVRPSVLAWCRKIGFVQDRLQ